MHTADYRMSEPFDGQRIVVVGAGNSAVQIAAELAGRAQVTLAARHPVWFARQQLQGRGLHWWLARTGADTLPVGRFLATRPGQPVIDDGRYRAALASARPDRRPAFTGVDGTKVTWADGTTEEVDTIVLATGYRPDLGYLNLSGALDGRPATESESCSRTRTRPKPIWTGSAVCRRTPCAAWGATPPSSSAVSPPACTAPDSRPGPRPTGSTYVNIDACRIRGSCPCWTPPMTR